MSIPPSLFYFLGYFNCMRAELYIFHPHFVILLPGTTSTTFHPTFQHHPLPLYFHWTILFNTLCYQCQPHFFSFYPYPHFCISFLFLSLCIFSAPPPFLIYLWFLLYHCFPCPTPISLAFAQTELHHFPYLHLCSPFTAIPSVLIFSQSHRPISSSSILCLYSLFPPSYSTITSLSPIPELSLSFSSPWSTGATLHPLQVASFRMTFTHAGDMKRKQKRNTCILVKWLAF